MSHYTEITTQFKSRSSLVEALVAMGIPEDHIEVHGDPRQLMRYNGSKSLYRWQQLKDERFKNGDKCHVIIRRQNVGQLCNDLGFWIDEEAGRSIAFVCDYSKKADKVKNARAKELGGYGESWMNRLKAEYGRIETLKTHEENGEYCETVEDDENVYIYASV